MKLGFTGTRKGMTDAQKATVATLLTEWGKAGSQGDHEAHHGDCKGADWDFSDLLDTVRWWIVSHPCTVKGMRGHAYAHKEEEPKAPLARNKDIVNACSLLLACPEGAETLRSGTWSTVRYARKKLRRIVIVWPDGTVTREGEE